MAGDEAVDHQGMARDGTGIHSLARRLHLMSPDLRERLASFVIPHSLCLLSKNDARLLDGMETPLGRLVWDRGLWLIHRPGLKEVGLDHRGDLVMRWEAKDPDPWSGPLPSSFRQSRQEFRRSVSGGELQRALTGEAAAWLEGSRLLDPSRHFRERVRSGGLTLTLSGNWPHFKRVFLPCFFKSRHPLMSRAADLLSPPGSPRLPGWELILLDPALLPGDEREYRTWKTRLAGVAPGVDLKGLPSDLSSSLLAGYGGVVFLPGDPADPVLPRTAVALGSPSWPALLVEVLQPLLARVLAAHRVAVFPGLAVSTGTRGAMVIITDGEPAEDLISLAVGLEKPGRGLTLLQGGALGLLTEEAGWTLLPLSRSIPLPLTPPGWWKTPLTGLEPVILDAAADFGASRNPEELGRVTHGYPGERILYEEDWDRLPYHPSLAEVRTVILLVRDPGRSGSLTRLAGGESLPGTDLPPAPAGGTEQFLLRRGGWEASLLLEACRLAATAPENIPPGKTLRRSGVLEGLLAMVKEPSRP
jgi:hypothetical protein